MDLPELRNALDTIDEQLIKLFDERMKIAEKVAEIKLLTGMPVFDLKREQEILNKAESMVSSSNTSYAYSFLNFMLDISKTKQRDIIRQAGKEDNDFINLIKKPAKEILNPRVVAQGIPGAYSNFAAKSMYPQSEPSFLTTWNECLDYIINGLSDYCILPVENSTSGSILDVFDLLIKYKLFIVKACPVKIEHCLLGVRGAKTHDIKEIYSNQNAFPQCSKFFDEHFKIKKISYANTAMAAQMVAQTGDKTKAAIASRECAYLYGLDILEDSIHNKDNNCTRFVSVSKKFEYHEEANKISVIFSLPHITGSLYRILALFANNGLNLTKIESRPDQEKSFEYIFLLDFNGSLNSKNTVKLLSQMSEELPNFHFLGSYNEQ